MDRHSVPREQWPDIDATFARARAILDSAEVADGYSLQYWANSIDYRAVDDMLKINAPLLLVQGTADMSSHLHTARPVIEEFIRAQHCNLTYWEMSGLGHCMEDVSGNSRLNEVLNQAAFGQASN